MSGLWRALCGATIGAFTVLLCHPISRPYLLTSFRHWGSSQTFLHTDLLLSNHPVLPAPDGPILASMWMEEGARRLHEKEHITKADIHKLIVVGQTAASKDEDNAYWRQMLAVFYNFAGDKASAKAEWLQGAKCARWDDYQTKRLKLLQQQLAFEQGGPASWQYSAVYPVRSLVQAQAIESYAQQLIRHEDLDSNDGLLTRYATLINGQYLRLGSRNIEVGNLGATIVEIGSYPQDIGAPSSPRKLVLARTKLYNQLLSKGFKDYAATVVQAFGHNDSWVVFTSREEVSARARELRAASLFTFTLPSALLCASIFGAAFWGLGYLLTVKPALLAIARVPIAPAVGVVLAAVLYQSTHLVLASIAIASCFSFLAFTPVHERTNPPTQLGPVYEITIFLLGTVMVSLFCLFIIGLGTPGFQLLPQLGIPREYFGGSTLFLGLCGIILGMLLLAAPCWAMIQRIPTTHVLVTTLKMFGRGMVMWCLALGVFLTPFAIIADNYLREEIQQMVLNEPVYYLNQ